MPAQRPHRRPWLAATTALVVGTSLATVPALPAAAAVSLDVSITAEAPTTRPSGSTFAYTINLACSGMDAPSCDDVVMRIPLAADMLGWSYDVTGAPDGLIESWSIIGSEIVIDLADQITAGTSQGFILELTPPNLQTPNGTTWSLQPTATGADGLTATAPEPATGTATAGPQFSVSKSAERTFYFEGDTITYTITATCPASMPLGSLYLERMEIVDTLPAGLTLVSTAPAAAWDEDARTLTWTWDGAERVPERCGGTTPDAAPDAVTVVATVGSIGQDGDDFDSYENVTNRVDVTATPTHDGQAVTKSASRTVVMLDDDDPPTPGTVSLGKSASGPLNVRTDAQVVRQGTYPGRWLPDGVAPDAPASTSAAVPASYTLTPRITNLGFQYEITDKLPCLDDLDASGVYWPSAGVCARPAFHAYGVIISYSGASAASPLPGSYAPQYRDVTGVLHDLVAESSTASSASWVVPTADLGRVAEIVIPRDPSQEGRTSETIRILGYADASTTQGQVLHNQGHATWWIQSSDDVAATRSSTWEDVYILSEPQIGAAKTVTNADGVTGTIATVTLRAHLTTPTTPTAPVVITDLLPPGASLLSDVDNIRVRVEGGTGNTAQNGWIEHDDLVVEYLQDFVGDRDLLRVTIPPAAFGARSGQLLLYVREGSNNLRMLKPSQPGVYDNEMRVFYDRADVGDSCLSGSYETTDVDRVRPDGFQNEVNCRSVAQVQRALSVAGQFMLGKTVQGDFDDAPQSFPSVGHVKAVDGLADWTISWQNTGAPTLTRIVLYDVFPHVGDTGIVAGQSATARGSQFAPVFAGVLDVAAGLTLEYSASTNPCRPEVYPGQGACDDDWTDDPAGLGGLDRVMALRIVSDAPYQTGQGFAITYRTTIADAGADLVAWNTVAAAASTTEGTVLLPTESPRVGVTTSERLLRYDKTVDLDRAQRGDVLTYTITVQNVGTLPSAATTVTDELPAGLDFVDADGAYDATTHTITFQVPALERGEEVRFSVVARIAADAPAGAIVNRATLEDPDGFPPAVTENPCADQEGSCAAIDLPSLPALPDGLGMTGSAFAPIVAIVALMLLAAGALAVAVRRLRAE